MTGEFKVGDRVRSTDEGAAFFGGRLATGDLGTIERVEQYEGFMSDVIQYKVSVDHSPFDEFWFNPGEIEKTDE